ncbi:hypothetical protein JW964_12930, partial [candidate division KSB1 bacterium]|nr:hypothetical protein [candidate division KSB1 bacterium]
EQKAKNGADHFLCRNAYASLSLKIYLFLIHNYKSGVSNVAKIIYNKLVFVKHFIIILCHL